MAARVRGEHLEIKHVSILTDGLNNMIFNQIQSKGGSFRNGEHQNLPTGFLYFWMVSLPGSYLTVSVP